MNSSANGSEEFLPVEESAESLDDDLFIPIKRAKRTIDHEMSMYASMYQSAATDQNPLNFRNTVENVRNFSF